MILSSRWPIIVKNPTELAVVPNLVDYDRVCAGFSWSRARADLDGLPGGRSLNIAHEAVDRHAVLTTLGVGKGDPVAVAPRPHPRASWRASVRSCPSRNDGGHPTWHYQRRLTRTPTASREITGKMRIRFSASG